MRKKTNIPFWLIIPFLFIYGGSGWSILLFMAIVGFVIYSLISSLSKQQKQKTTRVYRSGKSSYVHKTPTYSNADLLKVDEKLKQYFEENVGLKIDKEVGLTTSNGKYTNVQDLYLTFNDEKIGRMSDFANEHPDVYDKLMNMLVKFSRQKTTVKKETKKEEPVKEIKKQAEPVKKLNKAEYFIDKINELNDAIPHEELSNGMDETCQLLKQISLSFKGDDDDKMRKLYEYYLPMLVNALEKYRDLNDSPIHGEEFAKCENELMKTIILINQALKSLYNSLHEYEYMDLNADISTLQSILKKDGLVDDNPFGGKDEQ